MRESSPKIPTYFYLDVALEVKYFPGPARIGDLERQSPAILLFHVATGKRATRRETVGP